MESEDPDKKWITTWNDYLWRIKYFYRWLYNAKDKGMNAKSYDSWITPSFINIKMKRTKRLSKPVFRIRDLGQGRVILSDKI